MLIYFSLFLYILFLGRISHVSMYNQNTLKRFFFHIFFLFAFIVCLRKECVGEDTVNYVQWFKDFCIDGWGISFKYPRYYVEPGYKILNLLIASFSHDSQIIIIIIGIIVLWLHLYFLYKNSYDFFLSIILFFGVGPFFIISMTTFRQMIAMGIVFWILPKLPEKKLIFFHNKTIYLSKNKKTYMHYLECILLALLAFSFHKSSFIYLFALVVVKFLSNKKRNIWILLILEVVSIVILPRVLKLILSILPKYEVYFIRDTGLGKLRFLIILIEIGFLIFFCMRKDLHTSKNISIAMFVSISAYIGVMGVFIPQIFRLGYYFDYYQLLLIPMLLPKRKRYHFIFRNIVIIASITLFAYYLCTNAGGVLPYKFFWME